MNANTILRKALTEAESTIDYLRTRMRSIGGLDRFHDVTNYTTRAIEQTDEACAKIIAALAAADADQAPVDVEFKRLADAIIQATTNVARNRALQKMTLLFDAQAAARPAPADQAPFDEAKLLQLCSNWECYANTDKAPEAWRDLVAFARPAPVGAMQALDSRLEDLRYIVQRLARELKKADPNSGAPTGALAYLRRVGLDGSPLRAAAPAAPIVEGKPLATIRKWAMEDETPDNGWNKGYEAARAWVRMQLECVGTAEHAKPEPVWTQSMIDQAHAEGLALRDKLQVKPQAEAKPEPVDMSIPAPKIDTSPERVDSVKVEQVKATADRLIPISNVSSFVLFANERGLSGESWNLAMAAFEAGQQAGAVEECTLCNGMGFLDGAGSICPHCDGSGKERQAGAVDGALHDALIRCVKELPEDYMVMVDVMRGNGCVTWSDPDGNEFDTEGEGHMSDDVTEAFDRAIAAASANQKGE